MSDLAKRLRDADKRTAEQLSSLGPYSPPSSLFLEAATRIEALEAEVAALKGGLKPFADRYTWVIETFGENHMSGQIMVDWDAVGVAASLLEKKGLDQ